ncbi:MAG: TIGR03790 family protein [bacterium]|nr:TIGR03790 family protein [bacterium]
MLHWLTVCCLAWCGTLWALTPRDVLVVANRTGGASKEIAAAYCAARAIPRDNMITICVPDVGSVSQAVYRAQIEAPVLAAARARQTRAVVLCHGIPWRVLDEGPDAGNPLSTAWASVDAELATKGRAGTAGLLLSPNPYFRSSIPFAREDMLLVARLDGATPRDVLALIARATNAVPAAAGCAVIDLQPTVNGNSDGMVTAYNQMLARAAAWLRSQGLTTMVDTNQALIPTPATPVSFYWGWYAGANGDCTSNTFGDFRWTPGAVGVHVCSFGASGLRLAQQAVPGLVHAGVSATIGTVFEPLVAGWPQPDIFAHNYVRADGHGFTFIEAAYSATPFLSWHTVFVGDPLLRYTPAPPSVGVAPANIPRTNMPHAAPGVFRRLTSEE